MSWMRKQLHSFYEYDNTIHDKAIDTLMLGLICVTIILLIFVIIGGSVELFLDLKPNDSYSNRQSMSEYVQDANHKYDYTNHVKTITYNPHTDNLTVIVNKHLPTKTVMTFNPATKTEMPEQQVNKHSKLYRRAWHVGEQVIEKSPSKRAKNHVND